MIPRYSLEEMGSLFTDEARLSDWLEVEILAVEGWAKLGAIPAEDAKAIRDLAPKVDAAFVREVEERERVTDHDVAAFVDVVQTAIGQPAGSWVHYGLTSSDVVDTALCFALSKAAELMIQAQTGLVRSLKARALSEAGVPMMGRTHGMHAEPTTFGAKLALWCLQADRDLKRLEAAKQAVSVGKLSGAVGTYSNIDPEVESYVCSSLGLVPVPATQVVARDRHAQYVLALAQVCSSIEMFATEIRHLQRSEVAEVNEPFKAGQKGSSAMPHKRNPILSERLTGISRLVRGYASAAMEDVALWHERDISHSSVERVVLPDASGLAYYSVKKMTSLVDGLVVHADRMKQNLDSSLGLVFSQSVLLAMVRSGMARDSAYRIVQRCSREAVEGSKQLRLVLGDDPECPLSADDLDGIFSLDGVLRNVGRIFTALEGVGV